MQFSCFFMIQDDTRLIITLGPESDLSLKLIKVSFISQLDNTTFSMRKTASSSMWHAGTECNDFANLTRLNIIKSSGWKKKVVEHEEQTLLRFETTMSWWCNYMQSLAHYATAGSDAPSLRLAVRRKFQIKIKEKFKCSKKLFFWNERKISAISSRNAVVWAGNYSLSGFISFLSAHSTSSRAAEK